jgi:glycosyltransferase involved in cell wall biosynthesis
MRIGLNLLPVVPGVGGSWHYISSLIAALSERDAKNKYVAFVTPASASIVPDRPNFEVRELALHARSRPLRVAFENTAFRLVAGRARLDCMHHFFGSLPLFAHVPSVVTVHDLMVFERPWDFTRVKRMYLQRMLRRTAKHATVIAPVSRSTGEHIQRLFGVPWERMQVVPAILRDTFRRADPVRVERFRADHGLPTRFWVCVSGAYPHKNFDRLLAAFAALRRDDPAGWPLVIRGDPMDDIRRLIAHHGVQRTVHVLPRLADETMPLLYTAASALVSPSLFEGGGIPVMEAMACGCPVAASDIPTTREFASAAALRFDPTSVEAIVAAMRECEGSADRRAAMSRAGLEAARAFDPAVVVPACLAAYGRAVGPRP